MRRLLAVGVLMAALFVATTAGVVPLAGTQDTPSTTVLDPGSIPDIIPEPNSGTAPHDENDRGGWAQYTVLIGMVVGLGVIVLLVVRESRRKRADAAPREPVS